MLILLMMKFHLSEFSTKIHMQHSTKKFFIFGATFNQEKRLTINVLAELRNEART